MVASALRLLEEHRGADAMWPLTGCFCWSNARREQELHREITGHYWNPSESWLAAEQLR
jgi:hypothetical protein